MTLYLWLVGMALAAGPGTRGLAKDLVAVLEEVPPRGPARTAVARIAFRKTAAGWAALPYGLAEEGAPGPEAGPEAGGPAEERLRQQLPVFGRWTICREGRAVGALDTALPPRWEGPAFRGTHLPAPGSRPRWSDGQSGPRDGAHRPLLLNGEARCADPQRFAPAPLPRGLAVTEALQAAGAACAGAPGDCPGEVARWEVARSWASLGGLFLLEARAQLRGGGVRPFLFALDAGGVRLLGADLTVLEAGDWDGDGQTEVLARLQGPDRQGYALLFGPGLERRVTHGWRPR